MSRLTRRDVVNATIACPAVPLRTATACYDPPRSIHLLTIDWLARQSLLDNQVQAWQGLETRLLRKAQTSHLIGDPYKSDLPEARAMRELDTLIDEAYPALASSAEAIGNLPTQTLADALAKMELGLAVQGPFDWRDDALELLSDSLAALRIMTRIGPCRTTGP